MTRKQTIFLIISLAIGVVVLVLLIYFLLVARNRDTKSTTSTSTTSSSTSMVSESSDYQDVSPEKAAELIANVDDLLIIDVSPDYEAGHLVDAINYYVGDGSLDEAIPTLDKTKTYLVYCHVDSASISGSQKLVAAGFKKVYRLEGNYSAWVSAGYPVIPSLENNSAALTGDLGAVEGTTGSGAAYLARTSNKLEHLVTATLPEPEAGKFYEGWLVKTGSNPPEFTSTGKMFKTPEGQWRLEYVTDEAFDGYNSIVITVEQDDDGQPETHVLEGVVK